MTCKDYKYKRKYLDNGTMKYVIFAELYSTDDPSTLPTNAVGIKGFPENYPAADVEFEAGSYIYSVATGKVWIANEANTFIAQQ